MDAGLSFIMANHAKVKKNDIVFDPFVGTGKKTLESVNAGISADFGLSACKAFLALFQEACWLLALSLEPMSVELTLITTQFMAEVSFDRTNQLSLRAVSVFFYEVGRMAHFFHPCSR